MPVSDPEIIESFEKHAKQYFEYSYEKILQYQLNQFLGYLPGKKILDAGCGSGRDAEYLSEMGYELVGIDASTKLIEQAKKIAQAEFKVMALEDLNFKESFDGIWCLATLFYLKPEKAVEVLKKMHSILNEKGVLFLGIIEGEGSHLIKDKTLNMTPITLHLYKQGQIEETLEQCGFDILTSYVEDEEDIPWINVFARKRA